MTPNNPLEEIKKKARKMFDEKFCFDPAEQIFGNREQLKKEGWEVGPSELMLKHHTSPKDIKFHIDSLIDSTAEAVLTRAIEEVEGMEKKEGCICGLGTDGNEDCLGQCTAGFNVAVSNIKTRLRSLLPTSKKE